MANAPFGNHHCEIISHSDDLTNGRFNNCKSNPGHKEFMTIHEFQEKIKSETVLRARLKDNPSEIEERDILDEIEKTTLNVDISDEYLKNLIDATVRIVVKKTSSDRPDTYVNTTCPYPCSNIRGSSGFRNGTGCLVRRFDSEVKCPCPCPECRTSACQNPNRKPHHFLIKTASHVIFDKQEAETAVFDFFFDSEDRQNVEKVYGVTVLHSRQRRWETDTCYVVCVTHDDTLADKLSPLCDLLPSVYSKTFLVSHPHGISKRVSVGDWPERVIVVIQNKTCVKLEKDTEIRFPGCDDAKRVAEDINRELDKRVILFVDLSKTFVLLCDLFIYRPDSVVVDGDWHELIFNKGNTKVWWNVVLAGTQLKTEDGKYFTFAYKDDEMRGVRMEVFGKKKDFWDKNDSDKQSVFTCCRYNMVACPGSSGAHVDSLFHRSSISRGQAHLGDCGNFRQSGLECFHYPDGEQISETYDSDTWEDINYVYKRDTTMETDNITQGPRESTLAENILRITSATIEETAPSLSRTVASTSASATTASETAGATSMASTTAAESTLERTTKLTLFDFLSKNG